MAGFPDRTDPIRPVSGVIWLFLALMLSSCAAVDVLVVKDPYMEIIQGHPRAHESGLFAFRARLAGMLITTVPLEDGEDLSGLLDRLTRIPSMIVVTPPDSGALRNMASAESQVIVVGGFPQFSSGIRVSSLVPDRTESITGLGKLAAEFAMTTGEPSLALFDAGTEEKRKEISAFRAGLGNFENMRIINLADLPGRSLPDDFSKTFEGIGLLVLLAGPQNIPVLLATDDAAIPVITENLRGTDAWKGRIVASIEEDDGKIATFLLRILKSGSPESVYYYPSKLEKGILLKKRGR